MQHDPTLTTLSYGATLWKNVWSISQTLDSTTNYPSGSLKRKPASGWLGGEDGSNSKAKLEKMSFGSWGLPWDEILPYVAMGYIISKQKSTGYSPYFLLSV